MDGSIPHLVRRGYPLPPSCGCAQNKTAVQEDIKSPNGHFTLPELSPRSKQCILPDESSNCLVRPSSLPARPPPEEGIAIIGMGWPFPGGVTNNEEYCSLFRHGIDVITEVSKTP